MTNDANILRFLSFMRISIGIVYIWFGALKFFPLVSPAECLAMDTIEAITFGVFSGRFACILLAILEVSIGLMLVVHLLPKTTILLMLGHMVCTLTPAFVFPGEFFSDTPLGLTLVGQYIIKNIVFIAAAVVLYKVEGYLDIQRKNMSDQQVS